MDARKATVEDAEGIHALISKFADDGLLLPRTMGEIYRDIMEFFVCADEDGVAACGTLRVYGDELAELRSIAVSPERKGEGLGSGIVEACLAEARRLGVPSVFVLTFESGFFAKFGFEPVEKSRLPHKIWSDCVDCPKFPDCDEEAMLLKL
jgi:amino-acid N-acetyltransferase